MTYIVTQKPAYCSSSIWSHSTQWKFISSKNTMRAEWLFMESSKQQYIGEIYLVVQQIAKQTIGREMEKGTTTSWGIAKNERSGRVVDSEVIIVTLEETHAITRLTPWSLSSTHWSNFVTLAKDASDIVMLPLDFSCIKNSLLTGKSRAAFLK